MQLWTVAREATRRDRRDAVAGVALGTWLAAVGAVNDRAVVELVAPLIVVVILVAIVGPAETRRRQLVTGASALLAAALASVVFDRFLPSVELVGAMTLILVIGGVAAAVIELRRSPPPRDRLVADGAKGLAYAAICLGTLGVLSAIVGYQGTLIAIVSLPLAAVSGIAAYLLRRFSRVDTPAADAG